jgi:hypothetical protein
MRSSQWHGEHGLERTVRGQRREAEDNFGGGFTIDLARCATGRHRWRAQRNIDAECSGALG